MSSEDPIRLDLPAYYWPCGDHDIHPPHDVKVLVWTVGVENHYETRPCPGVRAHLLPRTGAVRHE